MARSTTAPRSFYLSLKIPVKNRPWLEVSENLCLFGTGVGSVAAVMTQQFLFAAAPLSCFLFVSLASRRRFEKLTQESTTANITEVDQRLTRDILAVRQQVLSLPNLLDLSGLKKTVLQKNQEAIGSLRREMIQRLESFEEQGNARLRQDIGQLREQYTTLAEGLKNVTSYLHRLTPASRVEGLEIAIRQLETEFTALQSNVNQLASEPKLNLAPLQEQINHLNRRFNNLPPPFDSGALKQDIDSL
ncbi:MAG: hypothetical protein SFW36_14245, partial [Leptolyngbyaceae cyanobacterium bins.59]|nr:hypothetical protein [Leptolyngbyaceae cyanobacterium bins.59]